MKKARLWAMVLAVGLLLAFPCVLRRAVGRERAASG